MNGASATTVTGADRPLVRSVARRVAVQVAVSCAIAVIFVAAVVFLLTGFHHHRPGEPPGDDNFVFDAVLIAGAVGIVIAGIIGWVAALRAVRPLSDALALQRRFVADASHELRTPLTILHTRAQVLDYKVAVDDPAKPLIRQLLNDSRVLGEVIDQLLLSAQIGNDPSRAEPVDVGALVDDVVSSMSMLAEQSRLSMVRQVDARPVVAGSPVSLRRALLALVDNAISHTPAGGTIWVSVTPERGSQVRLRVADNGPGADPRDLPRLTERFAQGRPVGSEPGDTDRTAKRRFGLGLSLVREIAHSHGGVLEIGDRPGGGFAASILLPGSGRKLQAIPH
ncbi:signal transduction histidine kinase [Antricoccus suffuscus]|uniref:histidine kinase n=1 Tax=Antricoccus suffuscus TaxID=1629062 RepID=A0A2T0ZXJ7_9ACTN|nr:HAMP domain-containing sensor histidine kinase [Antricoccus suffuscus]PRZ41063.1 signal transduction histidine kinase [Antricoccus suffuscus]